MDTSEWDVLAPPAHTLDIAEETLTLSPLTLGELPALIRAVRPFIAQLGSEPDWLALFCDHADSLLTALAIASRQPVTWVEALALDDALKLATALFEANADFFMQRVAPGFDRLAQRLAARSPGATPSPV
ncbi:hypothetical protein ONV78_24300 [Hahella sp. CR1]|uniref:DUF6631 family protein n=1 Tax=Hahella sp. CR1 TaxID=2992807 RepID=UPI002441170F|nr:DUF6631 family protein [Hahella sp. CR1]MDG9670883.1 hypothetical protein [Hahella sp. CR1]